VLTVILLVHRGGNKHHLCGGVRAHPI
jgi:hypothetical protein